MFYYFTVNVGWRFVAESSDAGGDEEQRQTCEL